MSKIIVIGAGHVGLTTAVCLAELGNNIICVDTNKEKINSLQKGRIVIEEPNLNELMDKNREKINFTISNDNIYITAKIIIICVQTPLKNNNDIELKYFWNVINKIISRVNNESIIIIKSTVPVGTADKVKEKIKKETKKQIYVVSNPEFLSQGSAVKDTLNPSRIVIGSNSNKAINTIKKLYKDIKTEYVITDNSSAEMIKYVSNSFLALKISYINEIANLCEKMNINIEEVTRGISLEKRIGNSFLNPGVGYGGSCLPKDTKALYKIAQKNKCDLQILKAVIEVNEKQQLKLIEKARKIFKNFNDKNIAILGITYKPNTDDIRGAPALSNIEKLIKEGAHIKVYNPHINKKVIEKYYGEIMCKNSIEETLKDTDICFIFTDLEEIKNIDKKIFIKNMETPVIFDGRNCFNINEMKKYNIRYFSIGR